MIGRWWRALGAFLLDLFHFVLCRVSACREQRFAHDGTEVRYLDCWKDRDPVVLIHGFADRPESFLLLARLIRNHHRVLMPALPGFWTDLEGPVDVARLSTFVLAAMDHAGVQQAHLVGNSLGGAIALHLAHHAPERVRSVIPLDSAGVDAPGVRSVNDEIREGHNLFRLHQRRDLAPFLRRVFHRPPPAIGPVFAHLFAEIRDRGPVFDRIMADLHAEGLRREAQGAIVPLESLPQPSLVVWGAHDDLFPPTVGRHMAERLGSELVVLGQAGHCPHMESPIALARVCRGFWLPQ